MQDKRRKSSLVNVLVIAMLVALPVGYVISYPLAVRASGGLNPDLPAYRPVELLIDNTPLRQPMFWWAEKCKVGAQVRFACFARQEPMAPPPARTGPMPPF